MDAATDATDLSFIRGQRIGDWVIADLIERKVLGAGRTPEEAHRRAGISIYAEGSDEAPSRYVLIQVQDPSLVCLY